MGNISDQHDWKLILFGMHIRTLSDFASSSYEHRVQLWGILSDAGRRKAPRIHRRIWRCIWYANLFEWGNGVVEKQHVLIQSLHLCCCGEPWKHIPIHRLKHAVMCGRPTCYCSFVALNWQMKPMSWSLLTKDILSLTLGSWGDLFLWSSEIFLRNICFSWKRDIWWTQGVGWGGGRELNQADRKWCSAARNVSFILKSRTRCPWWRTPGCAQFQFVFSSAMTLDKENLFVCACDFFI